MRHLLVAETGDINARDGYGRTPLHWSCEEGHHEVVEYLCEMGADIRIPGMIVFKPTLQLG